MDTILNFAYAWLAFSVFAFFVHRIGRAIFAPEPPRELVTEPRYSPRPDAPCPVQVAYIAELLATRDVPLELLATPPRKWWEARELIYALLLLPHRQAPRLVVISAN